MLTGPPSPPFFCWMKPDRELETSFRQWPSCTKLNRQGVNTGLPLWSANAVTFECGPKAWLNLIASPRSSNVRLGRKHFMPMGIRDAQIRDGLYCKGVHSCLCAVGQLA